jgi:hypothetical protein
MQAPRGGWLLAAYVLLGTVLGGAGAAVCSALERRPEPADRTREPNQPPDAGARRQRAIDPGLVVEGALCGFVLGAGAGALALRRARRG